MMKTQEKQRGNGILRMAFMALLSTAITGCKREDCSQIPPDLAQAVLEVGNPDSESVALNSSVEDFDSELRNRLKGDADYGRTGEFDLKSGRLNFKEGEDLDNRLFLMHSNLMECVEENDDTTFLGEMEARYKLEIDGQNLSLPYVYTAQYISIEANQYDDLEMMLKAILKPQLLDSLTRWQALILIISPDGQWHIPKFLIDEEKFKNELLWIEFKELDTYTYPDPNLNPKDKKTIRTKGRQKAQDEYHKRNHYPIFTDENRQRLIDELGDEMVQVPEEGEFFALDDIYSCRPEEVDMARYTHAGTYRLMTELAGLPDRVFHGEHGFPEYLKIKMILPAVSRTMEYQEGLRTGCTVDTDPGAQIQAVRTKLATDGQLETVSSHVYANAMDISAVRVLITDTRTGAEIEVNYKHHPQLMASIVAILHAELAGQIRDGSALGIMETHYDPELERRTPSTFHIVGKRH